MSLSAGKQSSYAFDAYNISTSNENILVFSQTLINEHGVYNTTTGKYTAPCDGDYKFNVTLQYNSSIPISAEFRKGDRIIGRFTVNGKGSGSAIERLSEGTEVYLTVPSESVRGIVIWDQLLNFITFSGHLISH